MTAELHRQFENSSPYDMIKDLKAMFEKQAGVERFDLIQTFHACKQEEGKPVAAYVIQMKGYVDQLEHLGYVLPQDLIVGLILNGLTKDFAGFVRNYNMHNMGKTIGELHAMLIEYEKGLPKKAETPQVMMIKGGKIQKANKKSLKAKGKGKANGKGKDKQVYIPKPKNPKPSAKEHPAKDDTCHHCKERRCFNLPLGRKWIVQCFTDFGISISKNNVHYFNAIPSNGKMTRKLFPHRPKREADLLNNTSDCVSTLDMCQNKVFETFKVFKNEVEKQLRETIKALDQIDGEYLSQDLKIILKAYMVRSMMHLITLPLSFWHYALESATCILNMVPTKKVDKTPYELWYRKVPNMSYLKVWGCEALVKQDTLEKLQQRSVKCIFIGYPKETMGYYFYFPPKNKIVVARYAGFFEKNLITQEVSGRAIDLKEIQDEDTSPSKMTSEIPIEFEGFEPPQEEDIPIHRSKRTRQAPGRLCLNVEVDEHSLGDLNEHTSYKAAMLDSESSKWIDAMNAKIQSMMDNMIWVLVDLPPCCKTIRSKWIFKKKTDMDGIVCNTPKYG
ncbi:retrotransposon protein, putative, ty1-copia subclass [Tanacetum coccineum]|uniref:Retrotransposon protein, putative, ty1-copia subclass n=1 Tax=Tanacetum coccineum TaxID=301880 RepID=A0ABQ5HW57_9ASTR